MPCVVPLVKKYALSAPKASAIKFWASLITPLGFDMLSRPRGPLASKRKKLWPAYSASSLFKRPNFWPGTSKDVGSDSANSLSFVKYGVLSCFCYFSSI